MKKVLCLSPTYTGGSWVCIEELIKLIPRSFNVTTIGLGEGRDIPGARVIKIPYPLFENLNPKWGSNIFANACYQLPLQILAYISVLILRPDVVISNGFTPVLLSLSLMKILRVKVVIYYGSFLKRVIQNKIIFEALKKLDKYVDLVFVNSTGSKEDLTPLISENKIMVIEHWTDIGSVSVQERKRLKKKHGLEEKFVITFVGRFSHEKGIKIFIDLIISSEVLGSVEYWFVGNGVMIGEVMALSKNRSDVKYKGFIVDRGELKELYALSDIVWSFSDDTYLTKPGVEAVAVGTPIIVPNTAAVIEKYKEGVKISPDLVPKQIGWVVDGSNIAEIKTLIKYLVNNKNELSLMTKSCINYAKKHYSRKNIEIGIKVLKKLVS